MKERASLPILDRKLYRFSNLISVAAADLPSLMVEEITKICSKLSINDEEETVMCIEVLNPSMNDNKLSFLLLGRILTDC